MKTIEIYVRFVAKVPDDVSTEIAEGKTEPFFIDIPLARCELRKSIHKPGQKPAYEDIEAKFYEYETMELVVPS
jgi:hypothetical protein